MLLLFPVCHQLINAPCFLLLYNKIFLRFLLLELTSYLLKYMYLYRRTNYLYQYIRSEAYMSYLDLILRLFQCPDSRPQGKHLCMFLRNQAKFTHYAYQQLRLWYCLYLYLCLFLNYFRTPPIGYTNIPE